MTTEQIKEAIAQATSYCKQKEEENNYDGLILRGVLYILGYTESEANEVLNYCAERGFIYCLDPYIKHNGVNEYPAEFACYWSPDQLRSRLGCV